MTFEFAQHFPLAALNASPYAEHFQAAFLLLLFASCIAVYGLCLLFAAVRKFWRMFCELRSIRRTANIRVYRKPDRAAQRFNERSYYAAHANKDYVAGLQEMRESGIL